MLVSISFRHTKEYIRAALCQFSPRFVCCKPWRNIRELLYYVGACWPCPCPLTGKVNVKVMFCGTTY